MNIEDLQKLMSVKMDGTPKQTREEAIKLRDLLVRILTVKTHLEMKGAAGWHTVFPWCHKSRRALLLKITEDLQVIVNRSKSDFGIFYEII